MEFNYKIKYIFIEKRTINNPKSSSNYFERAFYIFDIR